MQTMNLIYSYDLLSVGHYTPVVLMKPLTVMKIKVS